METLTRLIRKDRLVEAASSCLWLIRRLAPLDDPGSDNHDLLTFSAGLNYKFTIDLYQLTVGTLKCLVNRAMYGRTRITGAPISKISTLLLTSI